MGMREVWISIRGKEDVSAASAKAGSSLKSLGNQAKSLLENQLVQGIGFAGMVAGLGKAVDAANELAASTRKLEATAKITGVALDTLQSISARGQQGFQLSTTLANDFAVELAKLASKAGDVSKAAPGMEAFLDIGAARGLGAADTLQAVRQAILGIDEGTDKLFGKNPSVIYAEFAATIGTTAGKLTDQQKAMALLTEAMEDGAKVRGEYAAYLQTAAGQQEQLTNALKVGAAELGTALTPALLAVLPVLTRLVKGLGEFVGGVQLMAVDAAYYFEQIPNTVALIKGQTLEQLGLLLRGAGDFIPFFGNKVSALGDSLVAEGKRQVKASKDYTKILLQVREAAELEIVGVVKKSGAVQVAETTTTGKKVTTLTTEELAKRAAAEAKAAQDAAAAREKWNRETLKQLETLGQWLGKEQQKQAKTAADNAAILARALNVDLAAETEKALDLTTAAMERLLVQLRGRIPIEQWQALNEKVQQHKRDLSDTLPPASQLAEAAREAADENARMGDEVKRAKPDLGALAGTAATLARGFLDAAQATGLLDSNMASALASVVNIAAALPKALAGDASSIVAVVGGLANIITGLAENPAEKLRRDVLNRNSDAIARLTREVGNLNLGTSGRTFQGITDVFSGLGDRATALQGESSTRRMAGALALQADIKKMLLKKGISQKEAEDLFAQMGAPDLAKIFTTNDASLILKLVPQILAALQATEFGQFGQDFQSQLDALTKGFDVYNTSDADNKLAEFAKLAKRFSPALADALSGDLSTPEGRAQATKNLQGLFEKLKTGGLSPTEIGVNGQDFLSLLTAILPLLGDANGVLQNGTPVTGPTTIGDTRTTPFGMPGLPTSTVGIETPTITGSLVPAPTTITTTISGGITVINQFPNVEDSQDVLEKIVSSVDEALLRRYDALRAAQGQLSTVA